MRRPTSWRGVMARAPAIAEFPADRQHHRPVPRDQRRAVETVSRELATEASIRSVQPNFRYVLQEQNLQEQNAELTEGDPAQYAVAKLRLPQAHTLAHGTNVIVAVIDSGIDINHPELANAIAASFDALAARKVACHGTGIAGAIVAHARLIGSAPAARILAIRAFGAASNGAESSSYVILKDWITPRRMAPRSSI